MTSRQTHQNQTTKMTSRIKEEIKALFSTPISEILIVLTSLFAIIVGFFGEPFWVDFRFRLSRYYTYGEAVEMYLTSMIALIITCSTVCLLLCMFTCDRISEVPEFLDYVIMKVVSFFNEIRYEIGITNDRFLRILSWIIIMELVWFSFLFLLSDVGRVCIVYKPITIEKMIQLFDVEIKINFDHI